MARWGEIKCTNCVALEERLEAAQRDAKEAEAYAEELEAKLIETAKGLAGEIRRADAAEAKLAKAMEECAYIAESHKPSAALLSDRYWRGVDEAAHSIAFEIYATLAELTGGKNDG